MIADALVREIREMLARGELSQRQIARRVGVSRGTVHAMARGKRPDRPAPRRSNGRTFTPPRGRFRRCPTCGGMVQMPCLACYLRSTRPGPV